MSRHAADADLIAAVSHIFLNGGRPRCSNDTLLFHQLLAPGSYSGALGIAIAVPTLPSTCQPPPWTPLHPTAQAPRSASLPDSAREGHSSEKWRVNPRVTRKKQLLPAIAASPVPAAMSSALLAPPASSEARSVSTKLQTPTQKPQSTQGARRQQRLPSAGKEPMPTPEELLPVCVSELPASSAQPPPTPTPAKFPQPEQGSSSMACPPAILRVGDACEVLSGEHAGRSGARVLTVDSDGDIFVRFPDGGRAVYSRQQLRRMDGCLAPPPSGAPTTAPTTTPTTAPTTAPKTAPTLAPTMAPTSAKAVEPTRAEPATALVIRDGIGAAPAARFCCDEQTPSLVEGAGGQCALTSGGCLAALWTWPAGARAVAATLHERSPHDLHDEDATFAKVHTHSIAAASRILRSPLGHGSPATAAAASTEVAALWVGRAALRSLEQLEAKAMDACAMPAAEAAPEAIWAAGWLCGRLESKATGGPSTGGPSTGGPFGQSGARVGAVVHVHSVAIERTAGLPATDAPRLSDTTSSSPDLGATLTELLERLRQGAAALSADVVGLALCTPGWGVYPPQEVLNALAEHHATAPGTAFASLVLLIVDGLKTSVTPGNPYMAGYCFDRRTGVLHPIHDVRLVHSTEAEDIVESTQTAELVELLEQVESTQTAEEGEPKPLPPPREYSSPKKASLLAATAHAIAAAAILAARTKN